MRRFKASEIRKFLAVLDRELDEAAEIVMIGGAAASLAYQVERATRDIDLWSGMSEGVQTALLRAREKIKTSIPLEVAGVADAPYEFETRLRELDLPGLKHLRILVPEKHDLVLIKTVRAYEHDIETAEEIHRKHVLDLEILCTRFLDEMGHVTGDPKRLKLNFLAVVERLFGPERAKDVAARLHAPEPR